MNQLFFTSRLFDIHLYRWIKTKIFIFRLIEYARTTRWLVLMMGMVFGVTSPAHAAPVLFDDFSSCTSRDFNMIANTALGLADPIVLRVLTVPGSVSCTGWTFSGDAYLTQYVSGTPFPGTATQAIWLNEGGTQGRMTRTISGLTAGQTYRVSAQAWTDNVDEATALGLIFGTVTAKLNMQKGSGPQNISAEVCATSTTLDITFHEAGTTASSPVVTNISLENLNQPCEIPGYFTIGGTVSGLMAGQSVVLLNNGGGALTVSADGSFIFRVAVTDGYNYLTTVATQPNGQVCHVGSGSGHVTAANVTGIRVTCVGTQADVQAVPTLSTTMLMMLPLTLLLSGFGWRRKG